MSERELDSSINDYIETETPKNYIKHPFTGLPRCARNDKSA